MRSASKADAPARKLRRPFVAATFAITADGKITTRDFAPVDWTSREDKRHLLRMRAAGDAVLIGRSTLERDNVRLALPAGELRDERVARGEPPCPLRVIVSNQGRLDPALKIFASDISPIVIFSTTRMPRKFQKALREKATLHLSETRHVDLARMLHQLRADYGVRRVACEGGARLFRGLLALGFVDQLNLTIAPLIFGGAGAPTITGLPGDFLPATVRCRLQKMEVIGRECFAFYRLIKTKGAAPPEARPLPL